MTLIMWCLLYNTTHLSFPEQTDIYLEIHESKDYTGKTFFLAPHENEHVINDYVAQQVRQQGGRFLIIRQLGDRHLVLRFQGQTLEVDPNRIFTPAGVRNSLLRLNPDLDEDSPLFKKALDRAVGLGQFICDRMGGLKRGTAIVAIHNNTDGYTGDGKGGEGTISIQRYTKKLAGGAKYIKTLHAEPAQDEDDLFFITDPEDFEAMKKAGWNVVLQHPQVAVLEDEDDGSLSVLAEKKGLRYINIEAQRKEGDDHHAVQRQMVDFVFQRLQP